MKAFEYPSPLHVKIIPTLIRETGASVLLATDTFVWTSTPARPSRRTCPG